MIGHALLLAYFSGRVESGGYIEIGSTRYPMPLEAPESPRSAQEQVGELPPYLPPEGSPVTLSQALDAGIYAIDRWRADQKALYDDA